MSISLGFFYDSTLTQPVGASLPIDREIGGAPVDVQLFLGSTVAARRFVPDTDAVISVAVADTDPATGWAATDIKLATSQAGLDAATAGAPLNMSNEILSGAANAQSFYLRFSGDSATPKTAADISLITNTVREYAQ